MCGPETLFSRSLSCSLRSPFQHVLSPFSTKITNFTGFAAPEPKFAQNSLPKPPIWPKFIPIFSGNSVLCPIFSNNQFFKPQFFVPFRSLSPHLRPFGQNTYTKIKVEYPPGSAPCPHIGYAPGAKLGESVLLLLGMHIYKIYTKHDGHSRPTERKNIAYRGGRTLKTPPPHTHTHTCFSTSPWEFLQPEIQP